MAKAKQASSCSAPTGDRILRRPPTRQIAASERPKCRELAGWMMQFDQLVELTVGGLAIGAIYGLIGLGFSMIIRATDILHFAQGEVMMLGAMFGWTAVTLAPLPFVAVLLVGMVFSGLSAGVIYLVVYRTLRVRHVPLMNIVIATIGVSILLQNVSMLVW